MERTQKNMEALKEPPCQQQNSKREIFTFPTWVERLYRIFLHYYNTNYFIKKQEEPGGKFLLLLFLIIKFRKKVPL